MGFGCAQIAATSLLEQIDGTLEEILRRGLVYELPVPRKAIAAVCEGISHLEQQISQAVALGLLEVRISQRIQSPDAETVRQIIARLQQQTDDKE